MVTTRSKTGSLPVSKPKPPPIDGKVLACPYLDADLTRSLDENVNKPLQRVQVARITVRQESKLLQLPVEILQEVRAPGTS